MSSTPPPPSRSGTPTARGLRRAGCLACLLAVATAGCGSSEREFTAREFVREADAAGARLKLERPLYTNQRSKRLYAVSVGEEPSPHKPARTGRGAEDSGGGDDHEHGGGSLAVMESPSAARAELQRCLGAATLLCYRASNVVLALEDDAEPTEQRRIADALRRMARGG